METPLVSVYIPTRNRSNLVDRAIKTVLGQTYRNIELIVVDDGSTDDTADVLSKYEGLERVTVIRNTVPQGACAARNRAIAIARGMYITGLDDDDEFTPDRIEHLVSVFSSNHSFICTGFIEKKGARQIHRQIVRRKLNLKQVLHWNIVGNQVFTLTERVRQVGGFDERLPAFQDYDLWVRLIREFGPALKVPMSSYIMHTAHEYGRISDNANAKLTALNIFLEKHRCVMDASHLKSMALLRVYLNGKDVSLIDICRNINADNARHAVAVGLERNPYLRPFGKIRSKVRFLSR